MEKEKISNILQVIDSPIDFVEKQKKLESGFRDELQTTVETEDITEVNQDQSAKKFKIVYILLILVIIGGAMSLLFNLILFILLIVVLSKI